MADSPLYIITVSDDGSVRLYPGPDFTPDHVNQAVEAVGAVDDSLSVNR